MKAILLNPMCPVLKGCLVEVVKEVKNGQGVIIAYETFNPISRRLTETVKHLPQALQIIEDGK